MDNFPYHTYLLLLIITLIAGAIFWAVKPTPSKHFLKTIDDKFWGLGMFPLFFVGLAMLSFFPQVPKLISIIVLFAGIFPTAFKMSSILAGKFKIAYSDDPAKA